MATDPQSEFVLGDEFQPWGVGEEYEFSLEEQYRLALESIVRWTDRTFDHDFSDALIVRAIAQVAEVALGIK